MLGCLIIFILGFFIEMEKLPNFTLVLWMVLLICPCSAPVALDAVNEDETGEQD
jgi:hypothetical protein